MEKNLDAKIAVKALAGDATVATKVIIVMSLYSPHFISKISHQTIQRERKICRPPTQKSNIERSVSEKDVDPNED